MRRRIIMRSCTLFILLLLLAPTLATAQTHALVNVEKSLTLRGKPNKTAPALDTLLPMEPVEVVGRSSEGWAQVKTVDGQTGWVTASFLTQNMFVTLEDDHLNARLGPGTEYDVIIEYKMKNLPLCVLDVGRNGWLKVMDFEGDRGWINPKMVKARPAFVIVRQDKCNFRTGPGTTNPLAFTAAKGVIFQVVEEKDGWLHVRHSDGTEGWVSAKLVFGWLDESDPTLKKTTLAEGKSKGKSSRSGKATKTAMAETAAMTTTVSDADQAAAGEGSTAKKTATSKKARTSEKATASSKSAGKASASTKAAAASKATTSKRTKASTAKATTTKKSVTRTKRTASSTAKSE